MRPHRAGSREWNRAVVRACDERGEAAPGETRPRQVDDQRQTRDHRHLWRRPSGEVDQRRLARDESARRHRHDVGDADDARDGDVSAVRIDAVKRLRVWVEATDLGDIDRRRRALRNLREPQARPAVHHPRIDGEPRGIDHLRIRWYRRIRAYRLNLPSADHHRSTRDLRAADGNDARIADRERALWSGCRIIGTELAVKCVARHDEYEAEQHSAARRHSPLATRNCFFIAPPVRPAPLAPRDGSDPG